MKKNRTLKLASGLLILCLITTCAISTTLAKYTTGGSASDTARVAKWGVEVSLSGTLFANAYKDNFVAYDDGLSTVMSAVEDEKVVAPGTKNDVGLEFRLSGTPEVDYSVESTVGGTIKEVFLAAGQWGMMVKVKDGSLNQSSDFTDIYFSTDGGVNFTKALSYDHAKRNNYYRLMNVADLANDYYPIVWTVTGTSAAPTRLADILAQIKANADRTETANTTLNETFNITWAWAFSVNDAADTILGNLAVGSSTTQKIVYRATDLANYSSTIPTAKYQLGVAYGMTFTVTQID